MATSGTTDFVLTVSQVLDDAYAHIGHLSEGEILNAERESYALRQLNAMLKSWTVKYSIWNLREATLPLVVGQTSYTVGPLGDLAIQRPNRIIQARWSTTLGIDTPIWIVGRQEYFDQPNKTVTGKPVEIYYDRQLTEGVIFVWPTADDATDTVKFTYEGSIENIDLVTDDLPFPIEWGEAVTWNLALRLISRENASQEAERRVTMRATEFLDDVLAFNNENTPLEFYP